MFYSLVKPLLFALDPEQAHDISLEMLQQFHRLIPNRRIDKPTRVMGLDFPNPVGLAAGLDKNADYLDGLGRLGFGFIEVGSVTPKPQPGNSQPRVFRLAKYQSLINRMGFNNKGVDYLVERLCAWNQYRQKPQYPGGPGPVRLLPGIRTGLSERRLHRNQYLFTQYAGAA